MEKSFEYAVLIVNFTKNLRAMEIDRSLVSQFIRSGTSIGANIEEAVGAASKKDFINKLNIAFKEARESSFWLKLLKTTDFLSEADFTKLNSKNTELLKMLYTSIKKAKNNKLNESRYFTILFILYSLSF